MAPGTRTQNAVVAVLASLAVGASAFAVWSVGRPHPSLSDDETGKGTAQSTNQGAAATSAPEQEFGVLTAEQSTSEAVGEDPPQPSIEGWVSALSSEADLLVVGDGFSNMPNQWVQLWAQHLGQGRPVRIFHWGEAADVSFNDPIVLSDSGEAPLRIWSASRDGSTIHAAAERYREFVEASATPDAVLITLGLSSANEDIGAGLNALVGQIDKEIPVLVTVGPEGLYEAGVADAILTWTQDNLDRVAVVDLRESAPPAPTAEQWAQAFQATIES